MLKFLFITAISVTAINAYAGNCLVQNGQKIGDCGNVNVNEAKPLVVTSSGFYSGNFTEVLIKKGVRATVTGNMNSVVVEAGAHVALTGNSGGVKVFGEAVISGNADWIVVNSTAKVTISGIVSDVSGDGMVIKIKGAIIGGVYIK